MLRSDKGKAAALTLGGFLLSAAPLAVTLAARWGVYVHTPGDGVRLGFGAIVCLALLFAKAVGRLPVPRRAVVYGVACLLSYLMEALLSDLCLLTGMALVGEVLDAVFCAAPLARLRRRIRDTESAAVTAEAVRTALDPYLGGRV